MARRRDRARHLTVDIHCHVETPEATALVQGLAAQAAEPMLAFANPETAAVNRRQQDAITPRLTDVATRLRDMDRMGIDVQAISTAPRQYYYWAPADLARQTARLINQRLAEICARYPDRFVGLATVPLQAPGLAVAELDHAVKTLGLRGVMINTNVAGEDLSASRFRPFFARAQELDILVFMHPSGFSDGRRLTDHYFINVIGNPLESTVAVSHLIFGGVLDTYPRLKICVAHGGGYLPAYSGRMDHAHAARSDCRLVIKRRPTSYLRKLYFDTIVFTHHQLDYLVRQWGADHLLLGTDYPYDMAQPNAVRFVATTPGLTDRQRAAMLGGNAARLLKLWPRPGTKDKAKQAKAKSRRRGRQGGSI